MIRTGRRAGLGNSRSQDDAEDQLGTETQRAPKGNVLVIGNSGVGKSTLINAVLGENLIATGFGQHGTTTELSIYENNVLPFRLIDTVGFEPSFFKRRAAINAIRKWSKNSASSRTTNTQIDVIWFCIDGTSSKLFAQTINSMAQATAMWPHVPVVAVITKSYSIPDRQRNIEMVQAAFDALEPRKNLRRIIPVVAQLYTLNEHAYAEPEGITELIELTHDLLPEGYQASRQDISRYNTRKLRAQSQRVIAAWTTSAVAVGAIPLPFPDGAVLMPIELAEVNAISKIYGIDKDERSQRFLKTIVEVGTVGLAAKESINILKAIPVVNLGASAMNAVIAGSFVAALGEGSMLAFEQVYLGNKSIDDVEWVKSFMNSRLTSSDFVHTVQEALEESNGDMRPREIANIVYRLFISHK